MSEWKEYKLDEVYDFSSGLSKSRGQFGFGYGFVFQNWTVPNLVYKSVKKLGVCATVDYCLLALKQKGKELNTENVLQFISASKEWKHKLKQPEFYPENVEEAIQELFGMYKYS